MHQGLTSQTVTRKKRSKKPHPTYSIPLDSHLFFVITTSTKMKEKMDSNEEDEAKNNYRVACENLL